MTESLPQLMDPDRAVFTISVAAHLAGMHPQTLRGYDRLGLVVPRRTRGRGRRYSRSDIGKLRLIQHLSQEEGINLNGIQRILALQLEREALVRQADQLRADLELARSQGRARVFTAETSGQVHLGRKGRPPMALTS